jgi:hypothetical protein
MRERRRSSSCLAKGTKCIQERLYALNLTKFTETRFISQYSCAISRAMSLFSRQIERAAGDPAARAKQAKSYIASHRRGVASGNAQSSSQ